MLTRVRENLSMVTMRLLRVQSQPEKRHFHKNFSVLYRNRRFLPVFDRFQLIPKPQQHPPASLPACPSPTQNRPIQRLNHRRG